MGEDDAFDRRFVKPAQAYAKLYPSITARLKAAYDSGHPMMRQLAHALSVAVERGEASREQRLRDAHRLSPQEARVALHLIDGGTVQSCAAALAVADSTVRSHLKAIFAKTGVRKQAHLASLLSGVGQAGD